jgi:hypothetical protein
MSQVRQPTIPHELTFARTPARTVLARGGGGSPATSSTFLYFPTPVGFLPAGNIFFFSCQCFPRCGQVHNLAVRARRSEIVVDSSLFSSESGAFFYRLICYWKY